MLAVGNGFQELNQFSHLDNFGSSWRKKKKRGGKFLVKGNLCQYVRRTL